MQTPDTPKDEQERLTALTSLNILDSAAEERFDRYTRIACRLFDVPIALVSLVDADRQWFKSRQGLDVSETPRDISFCGHTILDDQVLVVEDATRDERFRDNPLVEGDPNIRFYAGCPLAAPCGQPLGTLCIIDREPRALTDEDLDTLRDIGAMVSGELASLKLASTDALTGISNRRGFEDLAHHGLALCARAGQPASLVMIDLDGFKQLNDALGHEAGDRALQDFAGLMLDSFRDSDVVGRLGGDEFAALLTGTTDRDARAAVARLQAAVCKRNHRNGTAHPLSFSAGIIDWEPNDAPDLEALLRDADARMYRCKRAGVSPAVAVPARRGNA